ncbi:hypothetical protein CYY_010076 [Polysphondylium violaceum]|uniref:SH3 domain-containing protein n=1 Tax=Polysphondylium violaceum TaxID=133409 RepID=A0A8J4PKM4_9MYCE|nr:hypothetical protein CYY_010076 [Polysphondylium violaceum]
MDVAKPRGFSEDLWDKFESVVKKVDNGKHFTQSLSKFLIKQQQIESNYAKSLIKLCKDKSFAPDNEIGTLRDSFQVYREQVELIAMLHEDFTSKLEKIVTGGIDLYIEESRKQRKGLISAGEKCTKDLKTAEVNESKSKQNYEKLKKKQEEAHEDLTKQPPGAKELSARKKLESATKSADKADNEYRDSVKVLQSNQQKFYHEEMPKILDDLQRFEAERIDKTKDWLYEIIKFKETVPPLVIAHDANIKKSVEDIDRDKDIQGFIMATMSGAQKPSEAQYEPYQPSNSHLSFTAHTSPPSGSNGVDKRKSEDISSPVHANPAIQATPTTPNYPSIVPQPPPPTVTAADGTTVYSTPTPINNEKLSNSNLNNSKDIETVRALYDYVASEDNEISFKANSVIKVLLRDESGWWQGSVFGGDGKVGMFPSNFVESTDSQKKKVDVAGEKCKVLYDYQSECEGELEIKEGELLVIEYEDEGWFFGSNDKGASGRFPSNYVQLLK